jgi:hypothetical protein
MRFDPPVEAALELIALLRRQGVPEERAIARVARHGQLDPDEVWASWKLRERAPPPRRPTAVCAICALPLRFHRPLALAFILDREEIVHRLCLRAQILFATEEGHADTPLVAIARRASE